MIRISKLNFKKKRKRRLDKNRSRSFAECANKLKEPTWHSTIPLLKRMKKKIRKKD